MSDDYLSTQQAADLLGTSAEAVRRMVHAGDIAAIPIGGRMRIARSAVEAALATEESARSSATDALEAILGQSIASLPLLVDPTWLSQRLGLTPKAVRRAMAAGDLPSIRWNNRLMCPTPRLVALLVGSQSLPDADSPR